jgi:ribosomal protein S18 acetylase RimI-like enzyme
VSPELEIASIATPHLAMTYSLVPWDCELLGSPVAQISSLRVMDDMRAPTDFQRFETWRDEASVRLVSCRLDHLQLRESMLLESRAFRFIEFVYQPRFAAVQAVPHVEHGLEVGPASERDVPEIERIAATAFTTGRFLLDWRLGPDPNRMRYAGWIRNSIAHPTQRLLKAVEHGRIVAFFVVETQPGQRCYWHLTAIADEHQGRGLGRRVWQAMLMLHKADGIEEVVTLVSGHNLPVLNLYSVLGFRLHGAQMTFHWLRES